jgi:hypothetical protein
MKRTIPAQNLSNPRGREKRDPNDILGGAQPGDVTKARSA